MAAHHGNKFRREVRTLRPKWGLSPCKFVLITAGTGSWSPLKIPLPVPVSPRRDRLGDSREDSAGVSADPNPSILGGSEGASSHRGSTPRQSWRDRTSAWRPKTPLMLSMLSVCRGTASAVGPSPGDDGRRGFSSGGLRHGIEGSPSPTAIRGPARSPEPPDGSPPPHFTRRHPRPEPYPGRTISTRVPRKSLTGFRLLPAAPRRAPNPGAVAQKGC
jgi:hypothetical protein